MNDFFEAYRDDIFNGITNIVWEGMGSQVGRNNIISVAPFSDLNNIKTNIGTTFAGINYNFDGHEVNNVLGMGLGSTAARSFQNLYFASHRIEDL